MCPREGAGPSCAPHPLGFSRSGGFTFPGEQARRGAEPGARMPSASGVQALGYPPPRAAPTAPTSHIIGEMEQSCPRQGGGEDDPQVFGHRRGQIDGVVARGHQHDDIRQDEHGAGHDADAEYPQAVADGMTVGTQAREEKHLGKGRKEIAGQHGVGGKQIEEGIDAIVVVGTTGEGSTLTDKEHKDAIKFCVDVVAGRVPVIAGTGSNDTAYAIELTEYSCEVGADAMLLVTPYYNKATQRGMIESFKAIADASTKPCILYNVPSRTGCNLLPKTVAELAKHKNIVAIKEASGNISQVAELAALCGDEIDIYSGNDDQIVPILSLGGKGVISVLSNIMPKATSKMCKDYFEGRVNEARDAQLRLLPLVNALFCEVNPIPAKAAVCAMGFCENYVRLPLTTMEKANEEKLLMLMKEQNLI